MKNFVAGLLMVATAGIGAVQAQKLQVKDLPAPVQNTVHAEEAKGSTLKAVSSEKMGGATVYEVEMMVGPRSRDLIVDAKGAIVEAEDEVSIDEVPAPVKAALTAQGKVIKIERLTKRDVVTYEAQVEAKGKKSEIALDAAGKRVKS